MLEDNVIIATETLERNIEFVKNCDNKASVALATLGVIVSILISNNIIDGIINLLDKLSVRNDYSRLIFLVFTTISTIVFLLGIFCFIMVLFARVGRTTNNNSLIFFSSIAKYKTLEEYRKEFNKMSSDDLLNDLTKQIYINSKIASIKYRFYNVGTILSLIGILLMLGSIIVAYYM